MKNPMTQENAYERLEAAMGELKETAQNAETFLDFSEICANLSIVAEALMLTSGQKGFDTFDKTTLTNLDVLKDILDASAKLFITCDEYYR